MTQTEQTNPQDPRGRRFVDTCLADDGQALGARDLARIFQPGVSLGLALVAKVLARMGGRAWAEALPQEGGTALYLSLPLA